MKYFFTPRKAFKPRTSIISPGVTNYWTPTKTVTREKYQVIFYLISNKRFSFSMQIALITSLIFSENPRNSGEVIFGLEKKRPIFFMIVGNEKKGGEPVWKLPTMERIITPRGFH